jgi:hypothetical protein
MALTSAAGNEWCSPESMKNSLLRSSGRSSNSVGEVVIVAGNSVTVVASRLSRVGCALDLLSVGVLLWPSL